MPFTCCTFSEREQAEGLRVFHQTGYDDGAAVYGVGQTSARRVRRWRTGEALIYFLIFFIDSHRTLKIGLKTSQKMVLNRFLKCLNGFSEKHGHPALCSVFEIEFTCQVSFTYLTVTNH